MCCRNVFNYPTEPKSVIYGFLDGEDRNNFLIAKFQSYMRPIPEPACLNKTFYPFEDDFKSTKSQLSQLDTQRGGKRSGRARNKKAKLKQRLEDLQFELKIRRIQKQAFSRVCSNNEDELNGQEILEVYCKAIKKTVEELWRELNDPTACRDTIDSSPLLYGARCIFDVIELTENNEKLILELDTYVPPPWVRSVLDDERNISPILKELLSVKPSSETGKATYYNLLNKVTKNPSAISFLEKNPKELELVINKFISEELPGEEFRFVDNCLEDKMKKDPENRYFQCLSSLLKLPNFIQSIGKNKELANKLCNKLANIHPKINTVTLDKLPEIELENEKIYCECADYLTSNSVILEQLDCTTLNSLTKKLLKIQPRWYWTQFIPHRVLTVEVKGCYHFQLKAIQNVMTELKERPKSDFFQDENNLDLFMNFLSENKKVFKYKHIGQLYEHIGQFSQLFLGFMISAFSTTTPNLFYLNNNRTLITEVNQFLLSYSHSPNYPRLSVSKYYGELVSAMIDSKIFTRDPTKIKLLKSFNEYVMFSETTLYVYEFFYFLRYFNEMQIEFFLKEFSSEDDCQTLINLLSTDNVKKWTLSLNPIYQKGCEDLTIKAIIEILKTRLNPDCAKTIANFL